MRWRNRRQSTNIEDRRRRPMARKVAGGSLGTIVLVLVGLYFGIDPGVILQSTGTLAPPSQTSHAPLSPEEKELGEFVSVVLADTEDTWHALFRRAGDRYREPTLVLFSGMTRSACGLGQAAMGPFYCPADHKVYIDLSFYRDLKERHHAPGDFAQAYVVAHEVGNPLGAILGYTELLKPSVLDNEEARDYLSRIEEEISRIESFFEPPEYPEIADGIESLAQQRLDPQEPMVRGRAAA